MKNFAEMMKQAQALQGRVADMQAVREHPSVKKVMQHFPGARIAAVRPVAEPAPQEPDSDAPAPDEFKEDATN